MALWAQNAQHQKPSVAAKKSAIDLKDTLKEIRISRPRIKPSNNLKTAFSTGQQKLSFDSAILNFYQALSLSDLITEQSPVFVKAYGVNNLATMSIRGSSAAQSEVLWNGIPISNAATGISDISLLNGGLFNNVSIQYGGSSALFGSGNVGGALFLADDVPDFKPGKKVALLLGMGSFHRTSGLLKADWQNHRWHFGTKFFYEKSKNNFLYQATDGHWKRMTNARLSGAGGIFSADYLFKKKAKSNVLRQTLSLKAWYQDYDRQIPPALFESSSVKRQQNRAFRSLIAWRQKRVRSTFYAKLSFDKTALNYQDGIVLPNNKNSVSQWYGEAGWQWTVSNPEKPHHWRQILFVFAPLQFSAATGANLSKAQQQWRPAVVGVYKIQSANNRFDLNVALRREWWHRHQAEWLPGLNGSYQLFRRNKVTHQFSVAALGNLQRSYRVPNLDELFFSPGGNPDLKPEHGWNESVGLALHFESGRKSKNSQDFLWIMTHHSTLFNRNIRDWIYWMGGAIWTPHNLAEVHSRGLETETKITWKPRDLIISLDLKTAYVLATTTKSYIPNDGSIGKQIPYTPRYNGAANLSLFWHHFGLHYNHHYAGYRFTTTDESQFLKPYQSGNLQASYTLKWPYWAITLGGQIRNIWGQRFEIVNGRPMPGRNFLLTMKIKRF